MRIIAEGQSWTRVDAETFANERGHEICKQDVKDELRMIRGTGLYPTGGFTPPSTPFPNP